MKRNSTSEYLSDFTRREDALLLRLRNINISSDQLPHRLFNWRQMIGDSQIYLNELKNYVEIEESNANGNRRKR